MMCKWKATTHASQSCSTLCPLLTHSSLGGRPPPPPCAPPALPLAPRASSLSARRGARRPELPAAPPGQGSSPVQHRRCEIERDMGSLRCSR
jgi:hypothetical protein